MVSSIQLLRKSRTNLQQIINYITKTKNKEIFVRNIYSIIFRFIFARIIFLCCVFLNTDTV